MHGQSDERHNLSLYQRQILIKNLFVGFFSHFFRAFRQRISQSSFINYYATVHMGFRRDESKEGEIFLEVYLENP